MTTRREALARVGAFALIAVIPRDLAALSALGRKPFPHPDARPGITGEHVLPVDQLPERKRVRAAFDYARTNAELFDGVYCVCECAESMKHRSLLACFESRQPVGCWGCQEQAEFIRDLVKDGKTLFEVREAVDKKWG